MNRRIRHWLLLSALLIILPALSEDSPKYEYAATGGMPSKQQTQTPAAGKQDFYFSNLDVRSAFKALALAGNIDIVLSPNVKGKVSLNLTNKHWEQAMNIICQMMHLQSSRKEDYIYIQSAEEHIEKEKASQLVREIIKIQHSKVKPMSEAIKGLLSNRGKMSVVEQSNALIIIDLPSKVADIRKAIQILDIETYQVHIQAQIIELNSQDAQEIGINWGYASQGIASHRDVSGKINTTPPLTNDLVATSTPAESMTRKSLSLAFGLLNGKITGVIDNLLSEGKGEVVAKPQITTLDNTEARIFIGQKLPFNKLDENMNATTEFIEAGIELIVTPHITNDERIILDLAPKRSDAYIDAVSKGPVETTTEAKTTVVVNDGQTVVIGGLTSKQEENVEEGVPFLKDIPLLGFLFKYSKKEVKKKDLILFITPFIVRKNALSASTKKGVELLQEPVLQYKEPDNQQPISPAPTGNYTGQDMPDSDDDFEVDDEKVGDFLEEIQ